VPCIQKVFLRDNNSIPKASLGKGDKGDLCTGNMPMYVRMAKNNGSISKKMELRNKSLDKGRLVKRVQTRKFRKGDVLGKGKQLPNRIELSLGAEMKQDLL